MTIPSSAFATATPMRIGRVGLTVRDLDRVARFYSDVVGMRTLERDGERAVLGAGGTPLVELRARPDSRPDESRTAGLFHTAFLMPRRADLAHWAMRAARLGTPVDGASDHIVSEAIYLRDPEGNGVELYADRPPQTWQAGEEGLRMATEPLDVRALLAAADSPEAAYEQAPEGMRVGHIHLRVGDTDAAEAFYAGALGLDVTTRYPGASFLSSGGYHHHVAANVWSSRGAGPREDDRAGLAWFGIEHDSAARLAATFARLDEADIIPQDEDGVAVVRDPWGTRIRLVAA